MTSLSELILINPQDLVWTVWRNSSPEVHITLTHFPTGVSVSGKSKSERQLRQELLNMLMNSLPNFPNT